MRRWLGDRWIYAAGDSSLRGVVLAIYQQVSPRQAGARVHRIAPPSHGSHGPPWAQLLASNATVLNVSQLSPKNPHNLAFGWLDIVLDASGSLIAVRTSRADSPMSSASRPII